MVLGILFGESFVLPYPSLLSFTNIFLLSMAAVFLGGSFVSLEIMSSSYIIFLCFAIVFSYMFLSLQIKEFLYMNLFINDSVYGSLFFFLTGLHFFHLFFGLFFLFLLFWSCSYHLKKYVFLSLRVLDVHVFYNLLLFYWHFIEILWLFIFLVFYKYYYIKI